MGESLQADKLSQAFPFGDAGAATAEQDEAYIRIPRPVNTPVPVHVYRSAVNALLKGNRRNSETLAARYIATPELFAR